jgi:hypothetical protein
MVNFYNVEYPTSTSEEFEWNDDSGGVSTDAKHMKKIKQEVQKFCC